MKSAKSVRMIPLAPWMVEMLRDLHTNTEFGGNEEPVFAARNGQPLDHHNIAKRKLKPVVEAMKIPWVSWHTFRHSNATFADQLGLTVTERMRMLGHADSNITNHYTHLDLDLARTKLDKLRPN